MEDVTEENVMVKRSFTGLNKSFISPIHLAMHIYGQMGEMKDLFR